MTQMPHRSRAPLGRRPLLLPAPLHLLLLVLALLLLLLSSAKCTANAYVTRCESRTNCQGLCQNGGRCIRTGGGRVSSYACSCPEETLGCKCQYAKGRCTDGTCQNGGTCSAVFDGVLCSCKPGFFGSRCELEQQAALNYCQSHSCGRNGDCVSAERRAICVCHPGWVGSTCSKRVQSAEAMEDPAVPATVQKAAALFGVINFAIFVLIGIFWGACGKSQHARRHEAIGLPEGSRGLLGRFRGRDDSDASFSSTSTSSSYASSAQSDTSSWWSFGRK